MYKDRIIQDKKPAIFSILENKRKQYNTFFKISKESVGVRKSGLEPCNNKSSLGGKKKG